MLHIKITYLQKNQTIPIIKIKTVTC